MRIVPMTWANTQKAFTDRFAATSVTPLPAWSPSRRLDRATGRVKCWWLHAEPNRRVYVRRINISGNTRTRDEVIRREFRQLESAWYDGQAHQALA
jgi:outer membrane protein insertion porin family